MISGITWYDVLGVLPDAPTGDIGTAWEASRAVLQPAALAGAPPEVLAGGGAGAAGGGRGLARPGRPGHPGLV